jgi:hypothetical protein
MKQLAHLISVARKLQYKYAIDAADMKDEVQRSIQTAIGNASSVRSSGIMPFVKMLTDSQATLAINVTRSGKRIMVSPASVNPPTQASAYQALPSQIQAYLERYLEVFPTVRNSNPVEYDNLTLTLEYP